jgi:hypothetical protein
VRDDEIPGIDRGYLDLYRFDEVYKWFVCAANLTSDSVNIGNPAGLALALLPEKHTEHEGFRRGNLAFFNDEATDGVLVGGFTASGLNLTIMNARDMGNLAKLRKDIVKLTKMNEQTFDVLANWLEGS